MDSLMEKQEYGRIYFTFLIGWPATFNGAGILYNSELILAFMWWVVRWDGTYASHQCPHVTYRLVHLLLM